MKLDDINKLLAMSEQERHMFALGMELAMPEDEAESSEAEEWDQSDITGSGLFAGWGR